MGKELEQAEADCRDGQVPFDCKQVCFPHAGILSGPVVETDDRLDALGDSDHNGENDCVRLHHDSAGGQRNIRAVDGLGPIIGQGIVQYNLYKGNRNLIHAAADTHTCRFSGIRQVSAGSSFFQ